MSQRKTLKKSEIKSKEKEHINPTWGRAQGKDFLATFSVFILLATTPILVLYFYISCTHFDCQLVSPIVDIFLKKLSFSDIFFLVPSITLEAVKIFIVWYLFQIFLAVFLPGPVGFGQLTPAGNVLEYKVNGLNTWIVSHIFFISGAFYFNLFPATIIYDNWGPLLMVSNIYGYLLAIFVYIKAHLFPTHPEDRKFSGNPVYDFFMGIEFNPRIGPIDLKIFMNGRPGIGAWTLINLSFAAAQYRNYGYVTNSMIIVNVLHALYVLDFFYNEDWYLRTIDIAHDHFGWMLAWGDSVWLPWTYTLQGFFLVTHPVNLSLISSVLILSIGFIGYFIFRSCNYQKDYFRSKDGKCIIWGKPATFIDAKFMTSDGKQRSSKLLTSGWWGISRHFNYVGDLLISLAYCLACGFTHLLPYYYIIHMIILLVHRTQRDDERLTTKYGIYWEEYKKVVPWAICPYIY